MPPNSISGSGLRKNYVTEDVNSDADVPNVDLKLSEKAQKISSNQTTKSNRVSVYENPDSPYIYVNSFNYGIVWKNIVVFSILHGIYFYGLYSVFAYQCWYTWIFSYAYGFFGGMGVTAGAHRLWSHRSYKARFPLRIFLALCHCIAGQDDLLTWCRDHRVHHKFSDTDGDPHNSKRGFFFSHVGWLLTRKHPLVIRKGRELDLSDITNDPAVKFQRTFYIPLFFTFAFILPTVIPVYAWNESWLTAAMVAGFWRYITSLHSTWFVNSAAHMWGDRPYNKDIQPRENPFVSFGAFGEGFHNYHHSFPWDYRTSELGWKLNPTKIFIDAMAKIGLAYDLKRLSPEAIKSRKLRISAMASATH